MKALHAFRLWLKKVIGNGRDCIKMIVSQAIQKCFSVIPWGGNEHALKGFDPKIKLSQFWINVRHFDENTAVISKCALDIAYWIWHNSFVNKQYQLTMLLRYIVLKFSI